MTTIYFPADHTAAEWREMAADCRRRSAESFDRCDTDGFLSQAASDATARIYSRCAELADNDGMNTFLGLARVEDPTTLMDAEIKNTRYGYAWMIRHTDRSVSWFNESSARKASTRRANNAKKGFVLVNFDQEAVVTMGASWNPIVLIRHNTTPANVRPTEDQDD